jgi:hypothetical protein
VALQSATVWGRRGSEVDEGAGLRQSFACPGGAVICCGLGRRGSGAGEGAGLRQSFACPVAL